MSFVLLGILNSQAAGAVGAGAYDLLETTVLTSSTSSVSFTGLGSYTDYKHLQVRIVAQEPTTIGPGADYIKLTFNSFTSGNYSFHWLYGNGSSVVSGASTGRNSIDLRQWLARAGEGADVYGAGILDILDFSNNSKNTTVRSLGGAALSSGSDIRLQSGLLDNTAAITSMTLASSRDFFSAGSRFSLYGIR